MCIDSCIDATCQLTGRKRQLERELEDKTNKCAKIECELKTWKKKAKHLSKVTKRLVVLVKHKVHLRKISRQRQHCKKKTLGPIHKLHCHFVEKVAIISQYLLKLKTLKRVAVSCLIFKEVHFQKLP